MSIIISPEKTAIVTGVSKSAKLLAKETIKSDKILDYGCGKLRNSNFLLNEGFNVSILDTKKQLDTLPIDTLKDFEGIFNVEDIGFNKIDKYKAILCSFVLNVIPNKEDRIAVLNNIEKLLDNKAKAYIEVRGKGFLKNAKSKEPFNDGYILGTGKVKTFQKGFSKDDLKELINQSSLQVEKIIVNGDSIIAICKRRVLC